MLHANTQKSWQKSSVSLLTVMCGAMLAGVSAQQPSAGVARPVSVFVLDFENDGFQLTSPGAGVDFDLEGDGRRRRIGWTTKNGDDAFLFLDANENGLVDSGRELLGDGWRKNDGSRVVSADESLQVVQGVVNLPLGPIAPELKHVSYIDPKDEVFSQLRIWRDANHNGRSEAPELIGLVASGITRIFVGFRMRRTSDGSGNTRLLEGVYYLQRQGIEVRRDMSLVQFAR